MKTRTTVAHFFAPLPWPPWLIGQQVAPLAPPRAGFSFPQKQTLTYSVDWRVFPAGTAVLHFEATGDSERITANADTIGAINMLFHVGDRFQSTFDRKRAVPTSSTSRPWKAAARSTPLSSWIMRRANRSWMKRTWLPGRASTLRAESPAASLTC